MSTGSTNKNKTTFLPGAKRIKQLWPALAAVSGVCSLIAVPASALELGELTVESQLGQPLRASIAYALQPDEQLKEYCIFLNSGSTADGLPTLTKAKISVRNNAIRLSGATPIREPMLGMQISVNCPYTANLQREYVMFFDVKAPADTQVTERAVSRPARAIEQRDDTVVAQPRRTARRTAPARENADQAAVPSGSRYRVQPGDTLSTIVARISDRPAGLWPAVDAIFAANPDAFIDGDVNLLKAGSWLQIPDLYKALGSTRSAGEPPVAAVRPALPAAGPGEAYSASRSPADVSGTAFDSGFSRNGTTAGKSVPVTVPSTDTGEAALPSPGVARSKEFATDDSATDSDSPFVTPVGEQSTRSDQSRPTIMIPDTRIPVPEASLPASPPESRGAATSSWSFLAWLGGAGLAVFLGLLLFGRSVRQRFEGTPTDAYSSTARRGHDDEAESDSISTAEVDFEFAAVSSNAPSMSLDADLELGTGLNDGSDMDIARDFGFSASDDLESEIDLELPAETAHKREDPTTAILPANRRIESLVVESETLPGEDDYDMSMIVDATRQPVVDPQHTAKDLKAIPVGSADDAEGDEEYTLSREIDYKILEQDYEEEFTTTQALNAELARAAMELADTAASGILGDTAEMPHKRPSPHRTASLTVQDEATGDESTANMEITAEMTATIADQGDAVNDERIVDLDDTGINEARTATLLRADNDVTVEMDIESDLVDTKKTRAS